MALCFVKGGPSESGSVVDVRAVFSGSRIDQRGGSRRKRMMRSWMGVDSIILLPRISCDYCRT